MTPTITQISLVLLPGLDGTGLSFNALVAALPLSINPIVIRFPGDRNRTYQQLQTLVLDALPPTGPFVLLAESFSGPLAVMVASKRPKGLIGLVLCATFITPPRRWIGAIMPIVARPALFLPYWHFKRLKAKARGYDTPEYLQSLAEMSRLVRPEVIASRIRMVFKIDVTEALRLCDTPILYLRGRNDKTVPPGNLQAILKLKPHTRVSTVGESHMVLQLQPKLATAEIMDFISSLSPVAH